MNYKKFDGKSFYESISLTDMFREGIGISYRYQFLIFLGSSKSSFPTKEGGGLGGIECESVKEKLLVISTDHRGVNNTFTDKDRYAVAAIHGTAAALRKFKNSHPHHRFIESLRGKIAELLSHLQQRSLIKKVEIFLPALRSKDGLMNNVAAVAVAKALIAKSSDESLKVLDLDNLL